MTAEPEVRGDAENIGNLGKGTGWVAVNERQVNRHAEGHNGPGCQGDLNNRNLFTHEAGTRAKEVDSEILSSRGLLSFCVRHGLKLLKKSVSE